MNLQAKLTLGYGLLAALMVSLISGVDFANNMRLHFESTLKRADVVNPVAVRLVREVLNSQLRLSLREALRSPSLASDLLDLVIDDKAIIEIAVLDAKKNEVLADSDPTRIGKESGPYPDFHDIVRQEGWRAAWRLLPGAHPAEYYQVERPLVTPSGEPVVTVRVIIAPAAIREEIEPAVNKNRNVAIASVIGAFGITFLFLLIGLDPSAACLPRCGATSRE